MNSGPQSSNNIPVLTEVISVDHDTTISRAKQATAAAEKRAAEAALPPALTGTDLEQLEKTLRENVLRQLLSRVDFVLEHRVRDGLADVLQTAVEGLTRDIRQGLTKSLEDVVHRTVSQEISKIQSSNNNKT